MIEKIVETTPYNDQKMGTAGLRKKVKDAMRPNYFENFIQSIFDTVGTPTGKTFVIGGDGRYFNDIAIQKLIKICGANGVKKLIIGQNGYLSTPASSNVLRKRKADGGFILTASHNPGGANGDFGIKYVTGSGGQCSGTISDKIFENSKQIKSYKIWDIADVDLSKVGLISLGDMQIEIIDPIKDYVLMMQEIFDFSAIKKMFENGFTMVFDAMNAVTGPYAVEIFENILGAKKGTVINNIPMPDFKGLHPDPNMIYAKELVSIMYGKDAPDFGAACDGDGDRNMILGPSFFVSPSDSLAVLTANYALIPAYKNGISGVAKSAATSTAVCRVAKKMNIDCYETPTGWKYFGNLMDSGRITFCGEESFGTGSNHIREKDGLWAILFWLNIMAATKMSVRQIVMKHWQTFGRNYYLRFDFEGIDNAVADKLMAELEERLPSLENQTIDGYTISAAKPFIYHDPVDGTDTKNGLIINFDGGSRIVFRLSGTGTSGATLRVYIEKYEEKDFEQDAQKMLSKLLNIAMNIAKVTELTGKQKPDIIT